MASTPRVLADEPLLEVAVTGAEGRARPPAVAAPPAADVRQEDAARATDFDAPRGPQRGHAEAAGLEIRLAAPNLAADSLAAVLPPRERRPQSVLGDSLLLPERLARPGAVTGGRSEEIAARSPAPPAEPPILVTIGRIEVRAVMPEPRPDPAPALAWQPPVLTLDDYLRGGRGE